MAEVKEQKTEQAKRPVVTRLNSLDNLGAFPSGTVVNFNGKPAQLIHRGEKKYAFRFKALPCLIIEDSYHAVALQLDTAGGIMCIDDRFTEKSAVYDVPEDREKYNELDRQLKEAGILGI